MTDKFCIDCTYHYEDRMELGKHQCEHPLLSNPGLDYVKDPVTGRAITDCSLLRSNEDYCGSSGKYFSPIL